MLEELLVLMLMLMLCLSRSVLRVSADTPLSGAFLPHGPSSLASIVQLLSHPHRPVAIRVARQLLRVIESIFFIPTVMSLMRISDSPIELHGLEGYRQHTIAASVSCILRRSSHVPNPATIEGFLSAYCVPSR
jgi:uncharacterized membrane protein AbrB (regulator of aidB expression)